MPRSRLERIFESRWQILYPELPLVAEFKAIPSWEEDLIERKKNKPRSQSYSADFAHLSSKTLIEIQGGIWKGGRGGHSSGTGIIRDCRKALLASIDGWLTIPIAGEEMVESAFVQDKIALVLRSRLRSCAFGGIPVRAAEPLPVETSP